MLKTSRDIKSISKPETSRVGVGSNSSDDSTIISIVRTSVLTESSTSTTQIEINDCGICNGNSNKKLAF